MEVKVNLIPGLGRTILFDDDYKILDVIRYVKGNMELFKSPDLLLREVTFEEKLENGKFEVRINNDMDRVFIILFADGK